MNIYGKILKLFGWSVTVSVPDYPKAIICVAPHTSNWDFILGKLAYASVGRRGGFLMKESWFFWPLGPIFRAIGGVPVPRRKKNYSLTQLLIDRFRNEPRLVLAITPEGTRKPTAKWHTGFLEIARQAGVPLILAAIDFGTKRVLIQKQFTPTGDNEADMAEIKKYYSQFSGKISSNCITD
ncbi:MAG: 1-acyl-sn-glycerol-3-phosphate acyltransferase [Muribaculaceae bacterium]|nr:1-acyl-sn-glycerol-3-phosphate acyltransferase [Muribaculaceae bacterium]